MHRIQVHASRSLQQRAGSQSVAHVHGYPQLFTRHVIEQGNIGIPG